MRHKTIISHGESEQGHHEGASGSVAERDDEPSGTHGSKETETLLPSSSSLQHAINSGPDDNAYRRNQAPRWYSILGKTNARKPAAERLAVEEEAAESEVMYEMDEVHSNSEPTMEPFEYDSCMIESHNGRKVCFSTPPLLVHAADVCKARSLHCCGFAMVFFLVLVAFLSLLFATYQASARFRTSRSLHIISNGTSNFLPTTILISLDGFRADFLNRGLTPTLRSFIAGGTSPPYMLASFPTVTFPNHFTLVTGLYPESHGIVGNTFWDPNLQEEFYYTNQTSSMQPKWWNGEPLWVTAEKQGVRTAIHMWPGSEAHVGGVEPSYLDKYISKEPLSRKVDRILELLDLPAHDEPQATTRGQRPQLIAAYVGVVDSDGHKYGPNSTELNHTIADVDKMLSGIFAGLEDRNLTTNVNVVVVSDHGMATTSTERLVQFEDLIDPSLVDRIDGWPLYGLRPKEPNDLHILYDSLAAKATGNPSFKVYLRDENMPEKYHFSQNDRIAPLWIVPKAGWAIVTREEFDIEVAKKNGQTYSPRGLHGYNHEDPLMRAIFVARGPAFPHRPNSRLEIFRKFSLALRDTPCS